VPRTARAGSAAQHDKKSCDIVMGHRAGTAAEASVPPARAPIGGRRTRRRMTQQQQRRGAHEALPSRVASVRSLTHRVFALRRKRAEAGRACLLRQPRSLPCAASAPGRARGSTHATAPRYPWLDMDKAAAAAAALAWPADTRVCARAGVGACEHRVK
jgi:hypothetical protein